MPSPFGGNLERRRAYYKQRRSRYSKIVVSESDRERFLSKLVRDEETGCLEYIGFCFDFGHGSFHLNDKMEKAHRVAWVIAGNDITEERPHILHKCDNPPCCEPSHLWAGTQADNMADAARKGRMAKSKSGLPFGVQHRHGRYRARVVVGGKFVSCGTWDTVEEATIAAELARDPRHRK